MIHKIILNIVLIATLTGCATIFNSDPKAVSLMGTSTDTFTLTRNGMPMQRDIKIPQMVMIPNGWDTYALENPQHEICPIRQTVNGATFLNIILGGLIGVGIDAATGDIVRARGEQYCNI